MPHNHSRRSLSCIHALHDNGIEAMQERGRLQVSKVADVTIFDPQTITDNAGYKVGERGIPTTRIPYVVVNGKVVVKHSDVLAVKAGQEIRFPVEPTGRFAPVAVGGWLNQHTIGPNPVLLQIHLDDESGAGELLQPTE